MARKKTHEFASGPVGGPLTTYRVHEARQCSSKHSMSRDYQCQGLHGHDGPHWCYHPHGTLEEWRSKKDIKSKYDWASRMTPPGHKSYPDPAKQAAKYYKNFDRTEKIGEEPAKPIPPNVQRELDLIDRHRKRKSKLRRKSAKKSK